MISEALAVASEVYVPVTLRIRSASLASPTVTVVPAFTFAAVIFAVVTALMVCAPVRYHPEAMVWSVVEVLYVVAASVVSCSVFDPDTVTVPAVPAETYPAETEGVTL